MPGVLFKWKIEHAPKIHAFDASGCQATDTKQLNRGESGNKLSRALAIGSPEFVHATKEEQELAEACKRLIKNAIVCWNYMYLSQLLAAEKDKGKKQLLLEEIRRTSVASWRHINLQGEFDFSDAKLKDSMDFKISEIMDPTLLDFQENENDVTD